MRSVFEEVAAVELLPPHSPHQISSTPPVKFPKSKHCSSFQELRNYIHCQPFRKCYHLTMNLFIVLISFALIISCESQYSSLRFTQDSYNVTIQENCLPRTYVRGSVLMGVSLEDLPPSTHIQYAITGGDPEGFFAVEEEEVGGFSVLYIRTKTGLNDVVNRERRAKHTVNIIAEAKSHYHSVSSLTASTVVRIFVDDTNDNIPLFYPDVYNVNAYENLSLHSPLVNIDAQDADIGINGQVYYFLENARDNMFAVHPTSGQISLTRHFYSSPASEYSLKVFAKDCGLKPAYMNDGEQFAEANIKISVVRTNNASPRIFIRHLPQVVEHAHAHIYAIITVRDADEGRSGEISSVDIIDGDPERVFSISRGKNENEFNLIVLKLLDREMTPAGYNLTVRATDAGIPNRASEMSLHVTIADINDHFPVFLQERYEVTVNEEAPPKTPVVRVIATDTDFGNNGVVNFRILAGNIEEKFDINPKTGLIFTKNWLDAESKSYYSLTVAAIDQASASVRKQSSAKVIIRILDANDNAPNFVSTDREIEIDEDEQAGTYVTQVTASDIDSSENGFLSYSITNVNQVPFTIDPFDGVIRTSKVLDFETERRIYSLRIRASDWGIPFKREKETTLIIRIKDVNDNKPQFLNSECSGWIFSSTSIGTKLLTLKAIDLDAGSKIHYNIENKFDSSCWTLDRNTGVLSVNCNLRSSVLRNSRSKTIILNATASDGKFDSEVNSIAFTVVDTRYNEDKNLFDGQEIECKDKDEALSFYYSHDMNNLDEHHENGLNVITQTESLNIHVPEFIDPDLDYFEVSEGTQIGSLLFRINAVDNDFGYNGQIVYTILSGDEDSVFEINMITGDITVAASLDREKTSNYFLTLTAYDLGHPHQSSSKNVTISILDVNDNAPQFTRPSYSLHLPENMKNGTSVAQIIATDADEGDNAVISYELMTEIDDFYIDTNQGVLYLRNDLDRERIQEYELKVRAWDHGHMERKYSVTTIFITILDVNDCAPNFGAGKFLTMSVSEDYPVGAVVASLKASDLDLGSGGIVSYSIDRGNVNNAFRIDPETGIVRITSELDFEKVPLYNLTIRATDGGFPTLHSNAHLVLFILDVNESKGPPKFLQRVVKGWIKENQSPGSLVMALAITNPDGRTLQFSITGGNGHGYFTVNRHGEVRNLRQLDRETQAGYWLTVRAWSASAALYDADTCWVYIEVQDVNDHAPQTIEPSYRVYVPENSPIGTEILTLNASDGDATSSSSVSFFVRSVRGRRNSGAVYDQEGWGPDTDGDELFSLDRNTGVLRTSAPLDREYQSQYEVQVIVSDGELFTVTPVYVRVSDVNDNAPQFAENIYRVSVPERRASAKRSRLVRDWQSHSLVNEGVMQVYASDSDVGVNADLNYLLKPSGTKGPFKINPKTGMIVSYGELESGDTYDILVEVQDNGRPKRSSTARVLLKVVPIPEESGAGPILSIPPKVHLMETDPPGHLVTFIEASHPKDAPDNIFWYYITGGDNTGRFSIGVDSGLVTVARPLDRELQGYYRLTISVTDGVVTKATVLEITILDSNDHSPVFSESEYTVSVPEDAVPGSPVLTLLCRDQDSIQSPLGSDEDHLSVQSDASVLSPLYFSLQHSEALSSDQLFTVDAASGVLRIGRPLDREMSSSHLLTVSCRDRGARYNSDYARVLVTVTDTNDHWPHFAEETISATVTAGSASGSEVVRVMAMDGDTGESGRLSYSIVEGNTEGYFSLDPDLGILSLNNLFDWSTYRHHFKEYYLLIRATDHATEPRSASVSVRVTISLPSNALPSWSKAPSDVPIDTHAGGVVEVSEWTHRGSAIAMASVTHPMTSLHYSITGGNSHGGEDYEGGIFEITPSSGIVSLASFLDREVCDWYNLTISATNAAGVSRFTWLGIKVTDENDWSPEWKAVEYKGAVLESAGEGTPVLVLSASNPETTLTQSNHSEAPINTRNIRRKSPGDIERKYARDISEPSTADINRIFSKDVSMLPSIKSFSKFEHLKVSAVDRDSGANGRVSYSIAGQSPALEYFKVDTVTGAVKVSGSLTLLAGRVLEFSVWCADGGEPRRDSPIAAQISVYIEKENLYAPHFTKRSYESVVHLPTIIGLEVVCVEAVDHDDERGRNNTLSKLDKLRYKSTTKLQYSLSQPSPHFEFDGNSGCLTVKDATVAKGKHQLEVSVTDSVHTTSTDINIIVSDKIENSLEFSQEKYFAHFIENSTKKLNLLRVEVVNRLQYHNIRFQILNPNEYLVIKETSGVVQTTGKAFDREQRDHFSLIVKATEVETNRTGNVEVTVAILDVNDNVPVFVGVPYHVLLSTTALRGHVVTKVRAVDADAGTYGTVQYDLLEGSGDLFSVNRSTGEVVLLQQLMVPDKSASITVAAYDGGAPPLSARAPVIIRVVSAGGPMFSSSVFKGKVPEDSPQGSPVTRVSAESPSGAPLVYTIVHGDPYVYFDLHYSTGVLHVTSPLDYETQKWHNLTVRARDPSTGGYADASVTIQVTDVNDNAPEFVDTFVRSRVSEASVPGTPVAKVLASDVDSGSNGVVHYSCFSGCDIVTIDSVTGDVFLSKPLDADEVEGGVVKHSVTLLAKDGGSPAMSASATLLIEVQDFNDNAPMFTQEEFQGFVSPDAVEGHAFMSVTARDVDASDEGTLRYHILTGDPGGIFALDPVTGVLSVTSPRKMVTVETYLLLVSVSDDVHAVTAPVNISVLPVNHHSPWFTRKSWEGRVEENSGPGSFILQVGAEDPDRDRYGTLNFEIFGDEENRLFSIDNQGVLTTRVPLDREQTESYTLTLSVSDGGGKKDFAKVLIQVTDVNDNTPVFALPEYRASIVTDTNTQSPILKIEASDSDEGENSSLSFSLYYTNSSSGLTLFHLDGESGVISLKQTVSHHSNDVYQFFVRATDEGSPSLHSDVPVTVLFVSSDQPIPHSEQDFARYFLPEDAPIGTIVTSLFTGGSLPVTYTLLVDSNGEEYAGKSKRSVEDISRLDEESPLNNHFEVSSSGNILLKRPLDYEVRRTHIITVVNQTLDTPSTLDYMTIAVVVMDVNDNSPSFISSSYSSSVAEDSSLGSTVLIVKAIDRDDGNNKQVEYSLSEDSTNDARQTFEISQTTGVITLRQPLDREQMATHSFSVVASDRGSQPFSTTTNIFINVVDCNNHPPVFERPNHIVSVSEDADIGDIAYLLSVTDKDDVTVPLQFFISSGDEEKQFAIDQNGQMTVAAPLDRETVSKYSMTVTVSDGRYSANTTVFVNVIDVNDNGPVCEKPVLKASIAEDSPIGQSVLMSQAKDGDEFPFDRIRYAISGRNSDDFSIGEESGEVTTAKPLDREKVDLYELKVTASDWERREWNCELGLLISVLDVNDNAPLLEERNFSVTVPEDAPPNAVVAKIRASDLDLGINRRVHYSLVDDADEYFSIDSKGGLISLSKPLDREIRDSYILTVSAGDYGNPPLRDTGVVTVTVADINDNPPEFVHTLRHISISEDAAVGAQITKVFASSRDIGINARISYSADDGVIEPYVTVDSVTGVVTLSRALDYETLQSLLITITATDGGTPQLSATSLLNLTILDVNDNAPEFTQGSYTGRASEGAPLGEYISQLAAHDKDSGELGRVRYSITSGDPLRQFSIHPRTGALTLASDVDREQTSHYSLMVTATDGGSPSLSSSVPVDIIIGDINDNPPRFNLENYSAIVQEDKKIGFSLLRMQVTDADDKGNGAPFTWEIVDSSPAILPNSGSHDLFAMDQDGVLRLSSANLNHKIQNKYVIRVRVWDSGSPSLSSETDVDIKVVEKSKYAPTVFPLQITVYSYRKAYKGGIIGKVNAIDRDPYDVMTYSISSKSRVLSEEELHYFDIDEDDGTLVARTPLDAGMYRVNVSVSDGKFARSTDVKVNVGVLTEHMVDSSVVLSMASVSPEDFITTYKDILVKVIAGELYKSENQIHVLSLQAKEEPNQSRVRRELSGGLDVLIAIEKDGDQFFSREEVLASFEGKEGRIRRKMNMDYFSVMRSKCASEFHCSTNGDCIDIVDMKDDVVMPLNTRISSFVAMKFQHKYGCLCHQGFGGENCSVLVNACGHKPCSEYQICSPTDLTTHGYICHCPHGLAGPKCNIDVSKCRDLSCYHAVRPMSFNGKSYAEYYLPSLGESSSFEMGLYLRTRHSMGVISFASGDIDFSQLEVVDGFIQFRWQCGSGEGKVRSLTRVDDNKWHLVNVTRLSTDALLYLDGVKVNSSAPGDFDILNTDSNSLFIGGRVEGDHLDPTIGQGFVGCIDELSINNYKIPLILKKSIPGTSRSLKRFVNIDLTCPKSLPVPGICSSYPCFNGGSCSEISKDEFECKCLPRFTGKSCENDMAPCSSSPCLNEGICTASGQSYMCNCPARLSGDRCEYGVFCNPNPCQNGGKCEEGINGPICKCLLFTGDRCQNDINECNENPCLNGGTCLNFHGGFKCLCPSDISGEFCNNSLSPVSSISVEVISLLVIVFVILILIILIAMCTYCFCKRMRRKKILRRNNSVKLMSHVKNDLKGTERNHRNSKLCNVEADQLLFQGLHNQRPASITLTGEEALKLWSGVPHQQANGIETYELDLIQRTSGSDVINRQASDYVKGDHNINSKDTNNFLYGDKVVEKSKKPWNHHNNLNDSYFTPTKGDSYSPSVTASESIPSANNLRTNSSNQTNLDVPIDKTKYSPTQIFIANPKSCDASSIEDLQDPSPSYPTNSDVIPEAVFYDMESSGYSVSNDLNHPEKRDSQLFEKRFSVLCDTDGVIYRAPSRERVIQLNKNRRGILLSEDEHHIYSGNNITPQGEEYNPRPSTPLLSFKGGSSLPHTSCHCEGSLPGSHCANCESSALLPSENLYAEKVECPTIEDGRPLLAYSSQVLPEVVLCSYDSASSTPLLRKGAPDGVGSSQHSLPAMGRYKQASYEDILQTNNISLDSSDDAINENPVVNSNKLHSDMNVQYNIVPVAVCNGKRLDVVDKISNVDSSPVNLTYSSKIRNDDKRSPQRRKPRRIEQNNLGNPRSRKPIVKGDYGRVSDLSFINTDSEAETNEVEMERDPSGSLLLNSDLQNVCV